MLDAHVADTAGSLAADADTGEDRVGHRAFGDQHVLAGLEQGERLAAAAALNRDAIVAGGDVAAFNAHVLAGIDIDAVAVAAGTANGQVLVQQVLAIGRVQAPHGAQLLGGEIFETYIAAADRLDQRRMPQRILRIRPAADRAVARDLAGSDDAGVAGVESVDEPEMSLNPLAFPADLGDGIIGKVRRPQDVGVLFQAQNRIGAKGDGAGEIVARGNQHIAAAQHPAAVQDLLQRGGVLGFAVAFGAEVADVKII